MAYKIEEIEGIGPAMAQKLSLAKVKTVEGLLKKGCSASGRKELSEVTGISEKVLLEYVNMADLMRIKGVGSEFSELLEAAGVDTVKELRNRNAENLAQKLQEVNAEKKLTRRVPNQKQVQGFIDFAKQLEPVVTH